MNDHHQFVSIATIERSPDQKACEHKEFGEMEAIREDLYPSNVKISETKEAPYLIWVAIDKKPIRFPSPLGGYPRTENQKLLVIFSDNFRGFFLVDLIDIQSSSKQRLFLQ
ncbi:hypothetical protein L2E82_48283 [Cichorium intybus]|uniref:Uncharacterized protein n=1 Tax=Cichorium intybus TaxID=13427 RepID=A0ACB8YYX3_CICIN|nr:hypothetical protein L2E82_48283 [Cichorium intybus]